MRGFAYDGLGVERHPEARRVEHAEVVGAVADRDGLCQRDARLGREAAQQPGLALPVDDVPGDPAGELAVDDLQGVGGGEVEPQPSFRASVIWVKPPETTPTW